jgi:hypothetical protein
MYVVSSSRFLQSYVARRCRPNYGIFVRRVTSVDLRATVIIDRQVLPSLLYTTRDWTRYTSLGSEIAPSFAGWLILPCIHCQNSCLCDSVILKYGGTCCKKLCFSCVVCRGQQILADFASQTKILLIRHPLHEINYHKQQPLTTADYNWPAQWRG